ncbi:hypothetical protein D3C73_1594880 [compost metagenome]
MLVNDSRFPQSFGPGGADEVLINHLQHTGAGHAGHDGHCAGAKADGRKQQVGQAAF